MVYSTWMLERRLEEDCPSNRSMKSLGMWSEDKTVLVRVSVYHSSSQSRYESTRKQLVAIFLSFPNLIIIWYWALGHSIKREASVSFTSSVPPWDNGRGHMNRPGQGICGLSICLWKAERNSRSNWPCRKSPCNQVHRPGGLVSLSGLVGLSLLGGIQVLLSQLHLPW
jgi:hypothetical protein